MPKTLLLADDSVTIQKVVGITFANEDVELVTVDNGDDALVRARQIKPDLVLADIGMPGLDGYALCRAIRSDPNLARTPVLLLTGTFETYDDEKAREVGANGYISKPFEAQALVDRVQAMLAQSAAPAPARPAAPARPMPSPAAQSTPAAPQRPRLELPQMPGSSAEKPARPSKPRVSAPFEFDVSPEPSPEKATPAAPLWEAEPDLESVDDAPLLRAAPAPAFPDVPDDAPTSPAPADATRLFAPDILGRPARLTDVPKPPPAAPPARADFSFGDLDFEEPTGSPANQTQIFGENSGPVGAETVVAATPAPRRPDERAAKSPLADPLYGKTRFLDPQVASHAAPSFDTPLPTVAPPLPDLLGSEEITAPSHSLSEIELSDAEPEIEAERLDEVDPFVEPFSPETSAALDAPEFAPVSRAKQESPRSFDATRLMLKSELPEHDVEDVELEPDLLDAEAIPEGPPTEPPPELYAWSEIREPVEPDPRPTAPLPSKTRSGEHPRGVAPAIDSALLSQTLEKVAWEAFGSLSEQVVNEVRKRLEAVVWEVVPQLCERLIREEIERLKAELPE